MKKLPIFLSLLLVFPFAWADDNGVVPIDMKLFGLIRHVDDFGRTLFDVDGKGAPGKATGRGAGIAGPPLPYGALDAALPEGHTCPNWGDDPTGIQLLEAQIVMTFNDGSMIWGNSPPDGYACFTGYAYAPYDIMGGSGRFEGATGWIVVEVQTYDYPPTFPRLATAETGIATGEIILP